MPDSIKVPPQNIEAEQSVLGSILMDKDAVIKIADILSPEDFYREDHTTIYRCILKLFEKRKPIDVVTLTDELTKEKKLSEVGGATYITTLVNSVPTAAHIVTYATIVHQKATLRRLISAAAEITELGFDETSEMETILDKAESTLFGVSQKYVKQYFTPIKDILEESFERIDKLHKEKGALRGVPTGFRDLDNILAGMQPSDLLILASRPSIGKSSLALNIADHVACDEKMGVGIFSLEMSKEQIIDRLLCLRGAVDSWKLRTGNLEDEDFGKLNYAMGVLSETPIFIDDSPFLNVMEIRTKARRLQMEQDLSLIIIDYLQLMSGVNSRSSDNRVQEVSEISRSLKALARELNVPILALSQLSRAVEHRPDKKPILADLRESGCLAGDTLVMHADTGELIPIKNLIGKKNIPVFSLNNRWQLERKKVSRVFSSGRKHLFELKARSGRVIKASANHPFLTINGWQRLDQLKVGYSVALPRRLKITNSSNLISNDEIILLAHLIGDGCVLSHQPVHYTSAEKANIEVVARIAKKLFSIKPRVVRQKNWYHVYLPSPYHLTHHRHHPIIEWFRKLGLNPVRSYAKVLPKALLTASDNQISLFLHHLWATDGNISWKKLPSRKPAGAIYYSTTSQKLAEQIQHLLLRLGIINTLRIVSQGSYKPSYQLHIQGSEQQLVFCKLVGCYGSRGEMISALQSSLEAISSNPNIDVIPKEAWQTFIEPEKVAANISWRDFSSRIDTSYCGSALFKAGLSRARLARVARVLTSDMLLALAKSDIYWDEIISITPLGIEEVFDATVPDTHNFVANDFIIHNSIEQDSDVVMFIYRDDYYDPGSERKNIAEILIRKHRHGPTGDVELYFKPEYMKFATIEKKIKEK